jgi:hypothetical protein
MCSLWCVFVYVQCTVGLYVCYVVGFAIARLENNCYVWISTACFVCVGLSVCCVSLYVCCASLHWICVVYRFVCVLCVFVCVLCGVCLCGIARGKRKAASEEQCKLCPLLEN